VEISHISDTGKAAPAIISAITAIIGSSFVDLEWDLRVNSGIIRVAVLCHLFRLVFPLLLVHVFGKNALTQIPPFANL